MANVAATNTTGLYGTTSKTPVLNSAQQLLSLLDNNGNVNFALDPATGNTTVYSYFTGNAGGGGGGGTLSLYGDVNASGSLGAPILTVLTPTGVTSGTYGDATHIPVINVGADGRVDSITTITTAASSYSNANVASYLPVYNGNITAAYVNIANLLTTQRANVTGNVNAGNVITTGYFVGDGSKLTNLPGGSGSYGNANVAAYMPTYLPTYHGTLSPTIISTDNYQFANGQPFVTPTSYGNANVAAYLASGTDSTINTLQSEITGANAAIVTANTAMKSYVDTQDSAITSAWTANAATQAAQIASTNANVTAANAAITATTDELHSFETYANATFSTGSYGNTQVAAYLPVYGGTANVGNIITTAGTHNIGTPAAPFNTINVGNIAGVNGSVVRVDSSGSQPGLYVATTGISAFQRDFAVTDASSAAKVTLAQTGQVTATAGVSAGTDITAGGKVTAQGNITANAAAGAFFIGDGSKLTNIGSYGNTQVAAYLPTYSGSLNNSSSIISLQGNIAAANAAIASTNANLAAFETYANATFGTSSYGNSNVAAYLPTYTGTVQVGSITTTAGTHNIGSPSAPFNTINVGNIAGVNGSVVRVDSSGSQPGLYVSTSDIQSYQRDFKVVDPTFALGVTLTQAGQVTAAAGVSAATSITAGTTIVAQGNITANAAAGAFFIGDGSKLTGISGSYGNANVAAYLPGYSGSLGGTLGTATQPFASNLAGAASTTTIGYNASITAAANHTVIGSKNNVYLNANIAADGSVGTTAFLNTLGQFVTANLVTTNGVFWSNGVAYSTGSGGTSFSGNLAGNALVDSVNFRILANASPASSLPSTATSSQVATVYTAPSYTTGVLAAPASGQSVIIAQSANIALQSSYASSGARNTIGSETYVSVYPTTANNMFNSDRVRSVQAHLDIIPGGKLWGNVTGTASQSAPVLSAMGAQTAFIGTGYIGHMVGHTASAFVYPNSGSANVAYQTGVFSSLGWNTATSATASNIANVRLISGNVGVGSQANLTITNAIGLHTASGWAGSGSLVTNRYTVLNEDTATVIQTSGNINVTGNLNMTAFKETITSLGSTSGTIAPASTAASVFTLTLTGNMTLNAANLSSMYIGQSITLVITQGGSGSYTLTSDLKFAGGSKTLSTAVGAIDVLNIFYDGTNYLASLVKGYA